MSGFQRALAQHPTAPWPRSEASAVHGRYCWTPTIGRRRCRVSPCARLATTALQPYADTLAQTRPRRESPPPRLRHAAAPLSGSLPGSGSACRRGFHSRDWSWGRRGRNQRMLFSREDDSQMPLGLPSEDHGDGRDRPEVASVTPRELHVIADMSRASLYMATGMPPWAAYQACGLCAVLRRVWSRRRYNKPGQPNAPLDMLTS